VLARRSPRLPGCRLGRVVGRVELVHDVVDAAARDLVRQLPHLAVDHRDRRLGDSGEEGSRSRPDRACERGQRVFGSRRPAKVDGAADQRAGAPSEQHPQRAAEDSDEHPDQSTACGSVEADVVRRLGDPELDVRRAFHDGGCTELIAPSASHCFSTLSA
jgi:hypothetical protein